MPPERRPKDSGRSGASAAGERRVFDLPPAERRRRRRELVMSIVVITLLVLLAGLIPLEPLSGLLQGVGEGGLFLFLNAVTVILIVVFGMLVTRNFWKLVLERRRGTLGSRLTLKFVAAFVLIAFVTTTGLFLVSALFITQSIDRWFSVQVGRALEQSGEGV